MTTVILRDHEIKAMREVAIQVRGIAPVIAPTYDTSLYRGKLLGLASILEDVLFRIDSVDTSHLEERTMVRKIGGDYRFDGTVVGIIAKLSGEIRYAVEDDRGIVHIFRREQLERR